MTLTLDLPSEAVADLTAHASRVGLPVERYAATMLQEALENAADVAAFDAAMADIAHGDEAIPFDQALRELAAP